MNELQPSEIAMGKAARLWTLPTTQHCTMQTEVAIAIAQMIDEYREALIWMSGATDFSSFAPWRKIHDTLILDSADPSQAAAQYREGLAVMERVEAAIERYSQSTEGENLSLRLTVLNMFKDMLTPTGDAPAGSVAYVPGADSPRGEFG